MSSATSKVLGSKAGKLTAIRAPLTLCVIALSTVTMIGQAGVSTPGGTESCFLGDKALAATDWESARAEYAACLSGGTQTFDVLSNMAVALMKLGRTAEAIKSYQRALEISPGNPQVRLNLSLALIKSAAYERAAQQLIKLKQVDPSNTRVQELLAFCYYHLQQYKAAAREAERVYRSHPDDPANALILGSSYTQLGLYDKAIPLVEFALKTVGSTEGHYIMGETFIGLRLYKSALAELDQVIAVQPDFPGLHSAIGKAKVGIGDSDAAVSEFLQAVKGNPNDFDANYYLGRLKRLGGDENEAEQYLRKALSLRPASPEVLFELAAMAMADRNYSKAERLLDQVIRQRPDHVEAHFLLSRLYLKTGRRESAGKEQAIFEKLRNQHSQETRPPAQNAQANSENAQSPRVQQP